MRHFLEFCVTISVCFKVGSNWKWNKIFLFSPTNSNQSLRGNSSRSTERKFRKYKTRLELADWGSPKKLWNDCRSDKIYPLFWYEFHMKVNIFHYWLWDIFWYSVVLNQSGLLNLLVQRGKKSLSWFCKVVLEGWKRAGNPIILTFLFLHRKRHFIFPDHIFYHVSPGQISHESVLNKISTCHIASILIWIVAR